MGRGATLSLRTKRWLGYTVLTGHFQQHAIFGCPESSTKTGERTEWRRWSRICFCYWISILLCEVWRRTTGQDGYLQIDMCASAKATKAHGLSMHFPKIVLAKHGDETDPWRLSSTQYAKYDTTSVHVLSFEVQTASYSLAKHATTPHTSGGSTTS
jgi:hypothetical protein